MIDEKIRLQQSIIDTQNSLQKLLDAKKKMDQEKLVYLEEKRELVDENLQLSKELDEIEKVFKICKICHERKRISLDCCSGGLCMECWDSIETSKRDSTPKCPYCRTPLPKLVDVLINFVNQLGDIKI